MKYNYLFGPVPSRRLGISLGVDLVPLKTCTLNCIYCECGRTTDLTLERKEYVPLTSVKKELSDYVANHPRPDYITFSGSGEPTLNSNIGDTLHFIRNHIHDIPVAILTNGTLFYLKQVREDIKDASLVMPSIDAATEKIFRKINRPDPRLKIDKIIEGLVTFRKEYSGQIWLEIFIVPGMNDTAHELTALKQAIEKIEPDQVQLNTLDRPGPVSTVRAATRQELEHIIHFWELENVSIIADVFERKEILAYRKDTESAILGTIARRPCTLKDLSDILGLQINEVNKYLDVLEADGKIKTVKQKRGFFYQLKNAAL
ncbi:MAG: radical SAM protein [Deltaproteobacteria bacterium]|nr:radical SAM protein [Deltaproteobacteria bacterium]MBW1957884.1 radical SAM protein [Deltaproteobacteria bacterium]MBW2013207.1 radical SAM protein [Deltaproteobacteria bacterium]MBW2089991.1 radical SAM protein [Deltaproteobacteria bacterium]MBW2321198.1 radical SAM protein [Deltaproteobacteria bacterium]